MTVRRKKEAALQTVEFFPRNTAAVHSDGAFSLAEGSGQRSDRASPLGAGGSELIFPSPLGGKKRGTREETPLSGTTKIVENRVSEVSKYESPQKKLAINPVAEKAVEEQRELL